MLIDVVTVVKCPCKDVSDCNPAKGDVVEPEYCVCE